MARHTPAIAMAVNPPGTNNIRIILQAIDYWLLQIANSNNRTPIVRDLFLSFSL